MPEEVSEEKRDLRPYAAMGATIAAALFTAYALAWGGAITKVTAVLAWVFAGIQWAAVLLERRRAGERTSEPGPPAGAASDKSAFR